MTRQAPRWSIRSATPEDAAAIALFHLGCWKDAYRGIVPEDVLARMDVTERTTRWRRRLTEGRRCTALAESPRRIVGIASWGVSHDPPEAGMPALELASLYVARAQWGSGLADALVEHAISDQPAHLWVYAANARARAFYARHGFLPDGQEQLDVATGVLECRYVRR
ncbi:MAG: GNAT family N-acetyltransferase [Nitrososphaerales archaeon]